MIKFILLFIFFILFNLSLRYPAILHISYLCDDSGLILGSQQVENPGGAFNLFFSSYGPNIIRPLQLIGMYIEHYVLSLSSLQSHIISLFVLSLAQALLAKAFSREAGSFGAFFGCLLIGSSLFAGEPSCWLSDRIDLYLLLFFSISCMVLLKSLEIGLNTGAFALCVAVLFVSNWGGFYSNEKATAVPIILCFVVIAKTMLQSVGQRLQLHKIIILLCVNTVSFVGYFAFRFAVLGKLIGGYDNSLIPASGISIKALGLWFLNLTTMPFRTIEPQLASTYSAILIPVLFVIIAFTIYELRRRGTMTKVIMIIVLIIFLCIATASMPTFKYIIREDLSGLLNTRFYWMPHIVISLAIGFLFGHAFCLARGTPIKALIVAISILFVAFTAAQGRKATKAFETASIYSNEILTIFTQVCGCVNPSAKQVFGLYPIVAGVNTYTEYAWFLTQAQLAGVKKCSESNPCKLEIKTEDSYALSFFVHNAPSDSLVRFKSENISAALPYRVAFYIENMLPATIDSCDSRELCIIGWVYEQESLNTVECMLLTINDVPALAIPPNIARSDIPPGNRLPKHDRYGFFLPLKTENMGVGTHEIKVYALREAQGRIYAHEILAQKIKIN
jgi:hypothetical protein